MQMYSALNKRPSSLPPNPTTSSFPAAALTIASSAACAFTQQQQNRPLSIRPFLPFPLPWLCRASAGLCPCILSSGGLRAVQGCASTSAGLRGCRPCGDALPHPPPCGSVSRGGPRHPIHRLATSNFSGSSSSLKG